MTDEEWEKIREMVRAAMKTDNPPPGCKLKKIRPNVFAWVKCTNDGNDDTTE